jgi:hypothetical protein
MNKGQRLALSDILNKLEAIKGEIESMGDEEQEKFDHMPESLQNSERGQAIEKAADVLGEAVISLEGVLSSLGEL